MSQKIIAYLAIIILAVSSCKKEDKPIAPAPPASKIVQLDVSSNSKFTVLFAVYRPTGQATGVVAGPVISILSQDITAPYQYQQKDIHSGDIVFAQIYYLKNDGFKAKVKMDGVEQLVTTTNENSGEIPSSVVWQFTVN